MSAEYSWILFPGSPFMPESPQSLPNVIDMINNRRMSPGLAIALEVSDIGTVTHELHEKDFEFLSFQYQIDAVNLSHYLFGFTTPTSLIIGAYLSNVRNLKEIIKILNPPTKDVVLLELSSYKAFHLIKAIEIYQSTTSRHPAVFTTQIFDLVRFDPFVLDQYFQIGLEASRILYNSLLSRIEIE